MDEVTETQLMVVLGDILGEFNVSAEQAWFDNYNPDPTRPQRPQINEYLRLQLGRMPFDTTAQRECLSNATETADYLRHFRTFVAPLIARRGLPAWGW